MVGGPSPGSHTARRLRTLRAAWGALDLGPDRPAPVRLPNALQALDPELSDDAFGAPAWLFDTGMPRREWLLRPAALRERLLAEPEPGDGGDAAEGRLHRFLRRNPVVEAVRSAVHAVDGQAFACVDAVLSDGRWGRLRFRNAETLGLCPPSAEEVEAWLCEPPEALFARFPGVCRTVVGPVWRLRDAPDDDFGLRAVVQAPEGSRTHLAVPAHLLTVARQGGASRVHPFAVGDPSRKPL